MSGSGFARPDLCSIHAAIEQVGSATFRRLLSADSYPVADDDPLGGACFVTSRHGQLTEAGQ
jgi:hypothetical protein